MRAPSTDLASGSWNPSPVKPDFDPAPDNGGQESGNSKQCSKCGETKELGEYYLRADGTRILRSACKLCDQILRKQRRSRELEETTGSKSCLSCSETKPLEGFYRSNHNRDGRQSYCKDCDDGRRRMGKPRAGRRWCELCCGLAHRVKGDHCRGCGLAAAPERPASASDWGDQRIYRGAWI